MLKRFDETLEAIGLNPISSVPSVYTGNVENEIIGLLIYVDDILLIYKSSNALMYIFQKLQKDFEVKDLEEANYVLGIEIKNTRLGITMSQKSYVHDILKRFRMEDENRFHPYGSRTQVW